ncbi:DUF4259 domain-containing protein [Streptomyces sp. 147326]|uniref:DUF4259 domain-containing protein n=1 Tax=Streptomyces sp. 147326 TaxID=3074379 RepID=UPI003857A3E0
MTSFLLVVDRTDDVDWSGLFHAFGPASDTPRHLAALLGDDAKALVDGYSHLWSTTLRREGKAWPSTAPTAWLVAELLDDPLSGPDDPSLPDAMLAYLHAVGVAADLGDRAAEIRARVENRAPELQAWTAYYLSADADARARMWRDGTELGELVLAQASLACFALVPSLLRRVLPHLASERGSRRACAAAAVGALARHPSASSQRPALLKQLTSMARAADSSHSLATILIAIGHLGGDTRPWLTDPHAGVRVCAAVAPGLGNDTAADFGGDLDEAALEERESMIRAALKRAADPADHLDTSDGERAVAAAALVVAQHANGEPACSNYGPSEPLPKLPADLRTLAVDALDQVVAELSELAELWAEAANGPMWLQDITRLRSVLDPEIPPQEEALFDV